MFSLGSGKVKDSWPRLMRHKRHSDLKLKGAEDPQKQGIAT